MVEFDGVRSLADLEIRPHELHESDLPDLMPFRIRDVLIVSSLYDSYILAEDGRLSESVLAEYYELRLTYAPRLTQVATVQEAMERLARRKFDLVIATTRVGDGVGATQFGRSVKELYPDLPVVVLAGSPWAAARVKEHGSRESIDQVFVWRGDVRVFLAIMKSIEDQRNVEHDTEIAQVRVILLLENSVRFYSSYLPMLYSELMNQTQKLMADGLNPRHRLRRMRARPKILLAESYDEGRDLFEKYRDYILGVISDVSLPRHGSIDPSAGIDFVRWVKGRDPDIPALVQSSNVEIESVAEDLGATFINKHAPHLLHVLRHFMETGLGFGDFVFRTPDGSEVGRAAVLADLPKVLATIPAESLSFHATRNHFSNWCMARTEFRLASVLRPLKPSDFASTEDMRGYLIRTFDQLQHDSQQGQVADFSRMKFAGDSGMVLIGSGSFGGKGRGLAFMNAVLYNEQVQGFLRERFPDVRVAVPPSVVLGTDVFDEFMRINRLYPLALTEDDDETIDGAFVRGHMPPSTLEDLKVLVERVDYPLAVRSSSLLEDSQDQPLAGIYSTVMISNNHRGRDVRLRQLCTAIKLVYASTFHRNAKTYLQSIPHRVEEEKMAVVLQKLVGQRHGDLFYPDFAGVARSYNFYPVQGMDPEDGIAVVALGLGKTVLEGERALRFSPALPLKLPQMSTTADCLKNAQRDFYALELSRDSDPLRDGPEGGICCVGLDRAAQDGTLAAVGSVYCPDNDAVYDTVGREGVRLVTFAPVLKRRRFPLADLLSELLPFARGTMSGPVEIEFAVDLKGKRDLPAEMSVLQVRPMSVETGAQDLDALLARVDEDAILCSSVHALGHGLIRNVCDVVYVRPDQFDRSQTVAIASAIGKLDRELRAANRRYLLIGPGRWGTSDRWLGIPVEWHQIAGVAAIVETDLDEVPVEPSEGTHFFQNLTSFGIGYFSGHRRRADNVLDADWLDAQPTFGENSFLRHVRLDEPLDIRVDGRSRRGLILKRTLQDSPS